MTTLYIDAYIQDCKDTGIYDMFPIMTDNTEYLRQNPTEIYNLVSKLKRTNFIDSETNIVFNHTKDVYELLNYKMKYYEEIVNKHMDEIIEARIKDIQGNPLSDYKDTDPDTLRQEMKAHNGAEVHIMIRNECHQENLFGLEEEYYNKHSHRVYYELCRKHEECLYYEKLCKKQEDTVQNYPLKYYKEIVDENRDSLIETCIQDMKDNKDHLPYYDYNKLREDMKANNYMLVYRMIEIDSAPERMFGLKIGCYYKHTHKLYYHLCVKHEAKLLADTQERFDKHFKTAEEKIEAMNLLMSKPNMIIIMRLICE